MKKLLKLRHMPVNLSDWNHWIAHVAGRCSVQAKVTVVVMTTMVALLWKERNRRLHGKNDTPMQQLFYRIQRESQLRLLKFNMQIVDA